MDARRLQTVLSFLCLRPRCRLAEQTWEPECRPAGESGDGNRHGINTGVCSFASTLRLDMKLVTYWLKLCLFFF